MRDRTRLYAAALLTAGGLATLVLPAYAAPTGRIVCWKDSAGKVVGCGDKVPPEYLSSGTRELDTRGVTRKQTESLEEANRRREREQEAARAKAEDDRKSVDQRRQDTALLETYASEREIELKRDRDVQVIDLQIEQLTGALKNTTQRYNDVRARVDALEKQQKPLSPALKDELERVSQEKQRFEANVQLKHKEKEDLRAKYADYRKRFVELRAQQATARR